MATLWSFSRQRENILDSSALCRLHAPSKFRLRLSCEAGQRDSID